MIKGVLLIVEDEADLLRLLSYNFKKEGFEVVQARSAEAGLAAARKSRPDLILLDIMLPKVDGLEMSRTLRKDSDVPIVFLTAKKSEVDRVLGLKIGGDDYVTKPFSLKELIARVEAVLRRSRASARAKTNGGYRTGDIVMDVERHEVRVKDKPRELTPKEFALLKLLFEARGKVLSREDLLQQVWGLDRDADISTRTVDQHVARLRRKLADERKRIVTVTNYGYQLKPA